jgi:hypothetical protein
MNHLTDTEPETEYQSSPLPKGYRKQYKTRQTYQAISKQEAAAFLGISINTFTRLIRQGYIRAFYIPHPQQKRNQLTRLRVEELNRFIQDNEVTNGVAGPKRNHWINPFTIRRIPVCLIARIVGIKGTAVSEAIQRGTLITTPEGLHDYILHRRERELITKIRAKYREKIRLLQKQVTYYKQKQNG